MLRRVQSDDATADRAGHRPQVIVAQETEIHVPTTTTKPFPGGIFLSDDRGDEKR